MLTTMWRKTLKITAWILGGLVGIPIAAYVAAVLINSHDEAPSADAVRLTASYEARAPVADDDNAFIYVLGFNAPLNENPRDVGRARLTWLQRNDAVRPHRRIRWSRRSTISSRIPQ